MNAMTPCPKDSALMTTWETYKTSEEYKMKMQAIEGALWAAFIHGWLEAGGTDPHRQLPTVAELQALLDSNDDTPIEIMPNGSVRALPRA